MEIGDVGTAYFDEFRFSTQMGRVSDTGSSQNFAEILKNTVAAQDGEMAAPSVKTAQIDKTDKLYEQCLELETFLIKTLISSMRNTVQKAGIIDEGFAGKMYEDMLYDEYAKDFAKNAHFGLAEQAYLELTGQRFKNFNNFS